MASLSEDFGLPTSSTPSLTQPTLHNTIGAGLIGAIAASWLFGVNTLQVHLYYTHWKNDNIVHKISVGVLWALDAFHLALTCNAVYHYCVVGFGRPILLTEIWWSLKLQIAVNVVIILHVQSLYAWRVWLLSGLHNGILKWFVVLALGGGCAIGIILAVKVYEIDYFAQLSELALVVDAALGASTTIDFVISGAMCYYLSKSKGHEIRLNSKISRVMQFTLSSGLLTSACSLSALFAFIFFPNTMLAISIESLLTKLYVGSFFAMLNARQRPVDRSPNSSFGTSASARFTRNASLSTSLPSLHHNYSRKFLALTSPGQTTARDGTDDIPSFYSQSYSKSSAISIGDQPDNYTAIPVPRSAQLPRQRYSDSPSTSPTSARPLYAEKW